MSSTYTTICLNAPQAREVGVAGSFNGWKLAPMQRSRDGDWTIDVWVPPGRHEFKFLVDGAWCCDVGPNGPVENAEGCVHNGFGTMNRVLEVPALVPHVAAIAPAAAAAQGVQGAGARQPHAPRAGQGEARSSTRRHGRC